MPRVPLERLELPDWADQLKPLDPARVAHLADEATRARSFEKPVHVLADGSRFVLLDGRHRLHAARQLGWPAIEAEVHAAAAESDALSLAVQLHSAELSPEAARTLARRLSELLAAGDRRESARRAPAALDPRRRRLLRELLAFLSEKKRVHDARLAQLFDLGDAGAARKLRVDDRGLPPVEPAGLHDMPAAVALAVRELAAEGLLAREEIEHLFPLNEKERLHLRAERALRALAAAGEERVKLKGTRWGPDYRGPAPRALRVVGEWPDGRKVEVDLEDLPGLDRHTLGIVAKALTGVAWKEAQR